MSVNVTFLQPFGYFSTQTFTTFGLNTESTNAPAAETAPAAPPAAQP